MSSPHLPPLVQLPYGEPAHCICAFWKQRRDRGVQRTQDRGRRRPKGNSRDGRPRPAEGDGEGSAAWRHRWQRKMRGQRWRRTVNFSSNRSPLACLVARRTVALRVLVPCLPVCALSSSKSLLAHAPLLAGPLCRLRAQAPHHHTHIQYDTCMVRRMIRAYSVR